MSHKIIVLHEAEKDLETSIKWFENSKIGLGYQFLEQVKITFDTISTNPEIGHLDYKNIRKILLKKFPYKIIYTVVDNKIVIIGIFHLRRNPDLGKDRR